MPKRLPLEERFFQKVRKTDSCWIWMGGKQSNGRYGLFRVGENRMGAHRFSFTLHKGKIPESLFVCHSCDNTLCVNPDHLWAGTARDNTRDMFSKGRQGSVSKINTHCRNGHLLAESGVYVSISKSGKTKRTCKLCASIARASYRSRKK